MASRDYTPMGNLPNLGRMDFSSPQDELNTFLSVQREKRNAETQSRRLLESEFRMINQEADLINREISLIESEEKAKNQLREDQDFQEQAAKKYQNNDLNGLIELESKARNQNQLNSAKTFSNEIRFNNLETLKKEKENKQKITRAFELSLSSNEFPNVSPIEAEDIRTSSNSRAEVIEKFKIKNAENILNNISPNEVSFLYNRIKNKDETKLSENERMDLNRAQNKERWWLNYSVMKDPYSGSKSLNKELLERNNQLEKFNKSLIDKEKFGEKFINDIKSIAKYTNQPLDFNSILDPSRKDKKEKGELWFMPEDIKNDILSKKKSLENELKDSENKEKKKISDEIKEIDKTIDSLKSSWLSSINKYESLVNKNKSFEKFF